jgi:hypothetical protein
MVAAIFLFGAGMQIDHVSAAPILVPYDTVLSPLGPPVTYEVGNPYSASNPVEYATFEPLHIFSTFTWTLLPIHAVFSTSVNAGGLSVAVVDFYHDGPAEGFPMNSYLAVYINLSSPIAASEIDALGLTTNTPSQQTGYITMASAASAISTIQHEVTARINPLSNLGFTTLDAIEISPNQLKIFYNLQKTQFDAIVDPAQPLFRLEMSVFGVPEPGSVGLATAAAICLAAYGWRLGLASNRFSQGQAQSRRTTLEYERSWRCKWRRISILQSSKILTTLYFLFGFLYWLGAIPMLIFGDTKMHVIGIIYLFMPIVMAVFGFIFFVVSAAMNNLLAGWLGGVEFETKTIDS